MVYKLYEWLLAHVNWIGRLVTRITPDSQWVKDNVLHLKEHYEFYGTESTVKSSYYL